MFFSLCSATLQKNAFYKEFFMMGLFRKAILGLCFVGSLALADTTAELKAKIAKYSALQSDFSQVVKRGNGEVVSNSEGTLALARPDSLMMHTYSPDEQYLFTRGNDVYFFDPFINQVTIFDKKDLYTSPFMLLTSDSEAVWSGYTVIRKGDEYTLTPKKPGEFTRIALVFTKNGDISSISITLKDGNTNTYTLKNISYHVDADAFIYHVPEDAQIDDERKSN